MWLNAWSLAVLYTWDQSLESLEQETIRSQLCLHLHMLGTCHSSEHHAWVYAIRIWTLRQTSQWTHAKRSCLSWWKGEVCNLTEQANESIFSISDVVQSKRLVRLNTILKYNETYQAAHNLFLPHCVLFLHLCLRLRLMILKNSWPKQNAEQRRKHVLQKHFTVYESLTHSHHGLDKSKNTCPSGWSTVTVEWMCDGFEPSLAARVTVHSPLLWICSCWERRFQ